MRKRTEQALRNHAVSDQLSNETVASESALNDLLCWTANEPAEVGYYWFKPAAFKNALIVDVFNHNGDMRFMVDGLYPGVGVGMVSGNARWSDRPIQRPTGI